MRRPATMTAALCRAWSLGCRSLGALLLPLSLLVLGLTPPLHAASAGGVAALDADANHEEAPVGAGGGVDSDVARSAGTAGRAAPGRR
jgi:hypothetical protein